MTALYRALYSNKPVATKDARKNDVSRWYYLDIRKSLDPAADREEAIISLPADRIIRNFRGEVTADYSTVERECAAELLPLPLVYDTAGLTAWQMKYLSVAPAQFNDRLTRWNDLVQSVIQRFQQYQLPLILLRKETPKEAVCQVFEKVNTGGVSLTVFELLTATFAADDYNLREDWAERSKCLRAHKVLGAVTNDELLQAVTLLSSWSHRRRAVEEGAEPDKAPGITCKRRDILRLTLDEYRVWADAATRGFELAARFIRSQKIFASRDLPYRTQLVPLAAVLAVLGERGDNDNTRAKFARWFWCGVFGELYGSAVETRFARDLPELLAWVDGGPEPDTVAGSNFTPARLLSLRSRNSAAYKGIYALLLRDNGLDFRTGEPTDLQMYFDDNIDIHHIFPQKWSRENGFDPKQYDSVINKTALSAKTNRLIGGAAPGNYLARLQKNYDISGERMDEILRSHVINPSLLRTNDFQAFFAERETALLGRVERAMGKPLAHEATMGESAPELAEEIEEIEEAVA